MVYLNTGWAREKGDSELVSFGKRLCLFVCSFFLSLDRGKKIKKIWISLLLFYFIFMYTIPFIFMNMMSLTICMIVLVAVVDVRHRMHSFHLQNIQVLKINTNSNSQGVIDPSRYFYFYCNNGSNNSIEYSIYIIIKLLTKLFCNKPLWAQWCYYSLHLLWNTNWLIC